MAERGQSPRFAFVVVTCFACVVGAAFFGFFASAPRLAFAISALCTSIRGLPFFMALADKGPMAALCDDPHLLAGLNVHRGRITRRAVAEALCVELADARKVIGA
jgi:alanine dehydrogenase